MNKEIAEQAMRLYQKKFGGNLAEISILFVNVTETLVEAEKAAQPALALDASQDGSQSDNTGASRQ